MEYVWKKVFGIYSSLVHMECIMYMYMYVHFSKHESYRQRTTNINNIVVETLRCCLTALIFQMKSCVIGRTESGLTYVALTYVG